MEMMRRGIDPFSRPELEQPQGDIGFTNVSRREVSENPHLAKRIVANAIVGIRSSTEVPEKFRKYFRYRWNFLILTVNYALPIGLVRFLLGQWCVKPSSLWLRRAVSFKKFLKKVPIRLVTQARDRLAKEIPREEVLGSSAASAGPARSGGCTPTDESSSEYDSEEPSDLD
jgi:hypothetical protein